MTSESQIKNNMNRMYRLTRHVYDASRKYYLLGRDHLIENIKPAPDEVVWEIGCGTARNLVKLAKRYPESHFYGLDASDEMLKTANKNLQKNKLAETVKLIQGYAQSFEPEEKPGKVFFSYSLSIIPPWKDSINHALSLIPQNGEIHIVDFGGQDNLPQWFRGFLFWWLSLFHVEHKPEILEHLKHLETEKKGTLETRPLYRGYAFYAVFKKS